MKIHIFMTMIGKFLKRDRLTCFTIYFSIYKILVFVVESYHTNLDVTYTSIVGETYLSLNLTYEDYDEVDSG